MVRKAKAKAKGKYKEIVDVDETDSKDEQERDPTSVIRSASVIVDSDEEAGNSQALGTGQQTPQWQ